MATDVFINAAKLVAEYKIFSCFAIYDRIGHGFSVACLRYRLMFDPRPEWYPPRHRHANPMWWNGPNTAENIDARVYALLLAHEINRTGDL